MEKYLVCDFDSTIVSMETLDEIAKFSMRKSNYDVDVVQKIEDITELGMQGKINFTQSLYMRLDLIKLHKSDIDEFTNEVVNSITVSVDKNKDFIKKNKERIIIVSGGFRDLIVPAVQQIGIDECNVYANNFMFDVEGNVAGFDNNNYLAAPFGKARQVEHLQLNGRVIMVGDGWTDYEVKQEGAADDFIAFTEHVFRERVAQHADCVAKSFDDVVKYYKKI